MIRLAIASFPLLALDSEARRSAVRVLSKASSPIHEMEHNAKERKNAVARVVICRLVMVNLENSFTNFNF